MDHGPTSFDDHEIDDSKAVLDDPDHTASPGEVISSRRRLSYAVTGVGSQLLTVSTTLTPDKGPADTARALRALAPMLTELAEALNDWDRYVSASRTLRAMEADDGNQ